MATMTDDHQQPQPAPEAQRLSAERREVAIFVLLDAKHRMLMEWREDWPPSPGAWVFPGGKVESVEDGEQAVVREAREELGIEIRSMLPLGVVMSAAPYVNLPFLVTAWDGEVPEHTDVGDRLRWSTPSQALHSAWKPAVEIAVRVADEEAQRATRAEQALAEARATVARLTAALPDPAKLWALAEWFDLKYPDDADPEVQRDLRAWARAVVEVHPELLKERAKFVCDEDHHALAAAATPAGASEPAAPCTCPEDEPIHYAACPSLIALDEPAPDGYDPTAPTVECPDAATTIAWLKADDTEPAADEGAGGRE